MREKIKHKTESHSLKKGCYWCGEFWSGYGGAGTAEFHSTSQIKITDLNRGNLVVTQGTPLL